MNASRATETQDSSWREQVQALAGEAGRAYLIAFRVTGCAAWAEEAVQEAYVALLEHPRQDRIQNATCLLYRVVHRKALNMIRSSHRRKQREENYAMLREQSSPSPDRQNEAAEAASAARQALQQLPEEERSAVSLCCELGLSLKVAAEILGMPERTLGERMHRGLNKLQRVLAAQGFAAAAPLLVAEWLRTPADLAAPPGLEIAVRNIAAGNPAPPQQLPARLLASRKSWRAAIWTTVGCALLLGGWSVYWFRTGTPPAPPLPEQERVTAKPTVKPTPRFRRTWDFNGADATQGLEIVQGELKVVEALGRRGLLCRGTDATVRLATPPLRLPVKVSYVAAFGPGSTSYSLLHWESEERRVRFGEVPFGDAAASGPRAPADPVEVYVADRFMARHRPATNRLYVSLTQLKGDPVLLLNLSGTVMIDDLTVAEIEPGELPDMAPIEQALESVEPARRKGVVRLRGFRYGTFQGPVDLDFRTPERGVADRVDEP